MARLIYPTVSNVRRRRCEAVAPPIRGGAVLLLVMGVSSIVGPQVWQGAARAHSPPGSPSVAYAQKVSKAGSQNGSGTVVSGIMKKHSSSEDEDVDVGAESEGSKSERSEDEGEDSGDEGSDGKDAEAGMEALMAMLGAGSRDGALPGMGGDLSSLLGGQEGESSAKREDSDRSSGLGSLGKRLGKESGKDALDPEEAKQLFESLAQLPEVQQSKTPMGKLKAMLSGVQQALGPSEELDQLTEAFDQAPEQKPVQVPDEMADFMSRNPDEDRVESSLPKDFLRPAAASREKVKDVFDEDDEKFFDSHGQVCNGLLIVGGGVRGAFGAGAVLGIAEQYKLQGKDLKWDVVSVGSLGAAAAIGALFTEPGQNNEVDFAHHLHDFWASFGSKTVLDCGEKSPDDVDLKSVMDWVGLTNATFDAIEGMPLPHNCDSTAWGRTIAERVRKIEKTGSRSTRKLMLNASLMNSGLVSEEVGDAGNPDTCAKQPVRNPLNFQEAPSLEGVSTRQLFVNRIKASSAISGRFPPFIFYDELGGRRFYQDAPILSPEWVKGIVKGCREKFGTSHSFKRGKGIMIDVVGSVPFEGDDAGGAEGEEMLQKFFDSFASSEKKKALGIRPAKLRRSIAEFFPRLALRHVVFPPEPFNIPADAVDSRDVPNLLAHGRIAGWHAFEDLE